MDAHLSPASTKTPKKSSFFAPKNALGKISEGVLISAAEAPASSKPDLTSSNWEHEPPGESRSIQGAFRDLKGIETDLKGFNMI